MSGGQFAIVMMLLLLAAYLTDRIGLYAVFGAFVLGVSIPRGVLTRELILERGVITPTLFSIMVFMAIVTTLMATPAFSWILKGDSRVSTATAA